MNQQAWFGIAHLPCYVWNSSATVKHNCYVWNLSQHTLAFVFMRLCWWIISQDVPDFGSMPSVTWETHKHSSHFPEGLSNPLTAECSQQENGAYCKTKREQDASAQERELSLGGRLLGPGPPQEIVTSLARVMTGNLPWRRLCKPAEAWSHLYSPLLIPSKNT